MNTIKMNGIKLSNQYILAHQLVTNDFHSYPVHLYQRLSDEKINILFLSAGFVDGTNNIICCVEPDSLDQVKKNKLPPIDHIEILPSVGLLSVYPHQFRLKALGYLLSFFGREKFKFYHIASSPSMLSFTVEYKDEETIASRLAKYINLPSTHTPYRQEINMEEFLKYFKKEPETTATYVEKKIKTYGIQSRNGMALCRLDINPDSLDIWGDCIGRLEEFDARFYYASSFFSENNQINLFLILDVVKHSFEELVSHAFPEELHRCCHFISSADFIYFHGPHFGDRYGIASQALTAMKQKSIPILLAGCVGSSINIGVPEGMSQKSRNALSEVFEMP